MMFLNECVFCLVFYILPLKYNVEINFCCSLKTTDSNKRTHHTNCKFSLKLNPIDNVIKKWK